MPKAESIDNGSQYVREGFHLYLYLYLYLCQAGAGKYKLYVNKLGLECHVPAEPGTSRLGGTWWAECSARVRSRTPPVGGSSFSRSKEGDRLRRLLVAVIAFMMAAGCSGGGEAPRLTGDLVYVRDGGFAGVHDELTIHPDRRARLVVRGNEGREFRLTEEEFGKVASAMGKADFDDLPAEPTRGGTVFDAFSHTINYQKKRLRAEDPSVPPSLRPLLSELQAAIGAHRPK